MKIAHVITRLVAGGAQRNTLMCAADQVARGCEVTVLSGIEAGPEGSLVEQARAGAYRFVEMPELVREVSPLKDMVALVKLVQWLRMNRPDIVHTHTSKAGILGRAATLFCRVPVVVHTPHGHVFHSYFSQLKTRIFTYLERAFAPMTDATVMLSQGELRDHLAERVGTPTSMYVIPSGVSLGSFQSVCAHKSTGDPVLGYIGRLADIKGPLDLIQSMPLVLKHLPRARLLVVGDGPLRGQVEDRIRQLGLQECVSMVGWQEHPEEFLPQMDVLVVPSHNEGMGRVVVEAMAYGLPIVATAVGGLVDLVVPGLTGCLVPPHDPSGLAEGVCSVLGLADRGREMGENAKSRALDFSDQVMFERLMALYSKLLLLRGVRTVTGSPGKSC